MSNTEENKEYKGPGKFVSAVGGATVESVLGTVVGAAGALALSGDARSFASILPKGIVTAEDVRAVGEKLIAVGKNTEGLSAYKLGDATLYKGAKKLAFAAGALALLGAIHGAYRGWTNVKAEKEQLSELNNELNTTKASLAEQKNFVDTLRKEREQNKHAVGHAH